MKDRLFRRNRARFAGVLAGLSFAVLAGCGGPDTCEEPEFYEYAHLGKRIEAPPDLDNLQASRELVIPEPSPRPPRDRTSGCLDRPPTLGLGKGEQ